MSAEERRIRNNRIRRTRQLRRRMFIVSFALCLSLAVGLTGFGFLSNAQDESHTVSYKYFTSVMVQPGDTLSSIARNYMDDHYDSVDAYITEVRLTNHMLDDDVYAGDFLIVPYYSTDFR